ncbi:MAG TPA: glycosyltransferase family 4 protein [Alphaproteobacteria bacterium]|nr:glycosyltransferase family 4 protein [Alphaproteobacteria bacterium]
MSDRAKRLAFIASHPIQYAVPLYRRLAQRDDLAIKVFYTWHAGAGPVMDRGFQAPILWDIPLTEGYEFASVANVAADPGTHRFLGLDNPTLVDDVAAWRPDVVHVTGWAWRSHLKALRAFHRRGIPTLFRGDSHLLDGTDAGPRWWAKRALLSRVYAWPRGFLVAGSANRAYYERLGVEAARLFPCPPSIDVAHFAGDAELLEREAAAWRASLGIDPAATVLLFAGKVERKKRPLELMRAVEALGPSAPVLVLVGGGELQAEIDALAAAHPSRFRVLPFANQSRMPTVYRLADIFVLPSAYGESWGLAVNEALACGRPALVSDRVGCAADLIDPECGWVFPWADWGSLGRILEGFDKNSTLAKRMRSRAAERARGFDVAVAEAAIVSTVFEVCAP